MSSLLDSNISDQIVDDLKSSVELSDNDNDNIIDLQSGGGKSKGGEDTKTIKRDKSDKKSNNQDRKQTVKKKNDKKSKNTDKDSSENTHKSSSIPEEDNIVVDYRDMILSYDASKNKSKSRFTTAEKAVILGKRVTQLAGGANAYIEVRPGMSIREIAEEEFMQKKIPYMIERPYGDSTELWKMADMQVKL